jgi:hypothetical protein
MKEGQTAGGGYSQIVKHPQQIRKHQAARRLSLATDHTPCAVPLHAIAAGSTLATAWAPWQSGYSHFFGPPN